MEIKLLSGALGAEIKGIDLTDISNENFKKINDLLLDHKVIFFRDQPITKKQQIALAERFGPLETHTTYNNEVKEGDEVEVNLTFFDHDKKRIHFKMEMIEKSSKKLSATLEMLSLYIDLSKRKVSEFEEEKVKLMDEFINLNKSNFNSDNLVIIGKLKK